MGILLLYELLFEKENTPLYESLLFEKEEYFHSTSHTLRAGRISLYESLLLNQEDSALRVTLRALPSGKP